MGGKGWLKVNLACLDATEMAAALGIPEAPKCADLLAWKAKPERYQPLHSLYGRDHEANTFELYCESFKVI